MVCYYVLCIKEVTMLNHKTASYLLYVYFHVMIVLRIYFKKTIETIFQSEHKKVISSQNEHYIDYMGWHLPKIYALNYTITDSDDWENNKRGMKYRIFYVIIMCFMQKFI